MIGSGSGELQFNAGGGFVSTSATPWISTANAGNNLCVLQSGTGTVAGTISYVIQ